MRLKPRFLIIIISIIPVPQPVPDRSRLVVRNVGLGPHLSEIPQAERLVFSVTDDVPAVAFRGAVGDAFGVAAEYARGDIGCERAAVPGRLLVDGKGRWGRLTRL